jgi:hypothetical protein
LPTVEPRLQRRYDQLVQEHVAPLQAVAASLRSVLTFSSSFASTQAAWRFWHNDNAPLTAVAQPLLDAARAALPLECLDYALVPLDWSQLHYNTHTCKKDRIDLTNSRDRGYELLTALLVSDQDGQPIAPLCHDLLAADGLHTTRHGRICQPPTKLDRLAAVMRFVHEQKLGKPPVFIIDREADSVDHYRRWARQGRLFLIRADNIRRVRHHKHSRLLPEVVAELMQTGAFHDCREVLYHGAKARQWVAETAIILDRPSKQSGGRVSKRGKALPLRLVVAQVRNAAGEVLAQWLLMTNVPAAVSADRVALWYYWRWLIETYFKLLKGAGLHLEHWQQETAEATAKRLAVAGMACVLVWKVARSERPEGQTLRDLLVRLSGRQVHRAPGFTNPSLLAGLYVLLNVLEVVEHYDPRALRELLTDVLEPAPEPPRRRPKSPLPSKPNGADVLV